MNVVSAPAMAAVLILTLSIVWFFQKMIKSGGKRGVPPPPGPRGLPIVGYLPFLRRDLHHQLTELAAEYGPIYKISLGGKQCTVISSASPAREVFRDQDTVFANHEITVAARIISLDVSDIVFAPYGQEWRDRRKILLREMLSNTNLKASCNLRKEQVRKAVNEVHAAEKGTPFNIRDLVLRYDLNLFINMIWGGKIGDEQCHRISAGLSPIVAEIQDFLIKPNISDFFPVLARFDVQGIAKDLNVLMKKFEGIMEDAIGDRLTNPSAGVGEEERKDFMQTLVDLLHEETHKASLGIVQIKAMLVNILLAGTDTTAMTIEWVMAELLSHPQVMEKVQHELDEVVGMNNVVEESHLPKLLYLDAVIKETMRVHPVGPLLPRTPSRDCTVGGYTIPKDSRMFVNIWSIQRDPAVWHNPSEFRPERFLADATGKWDYSGNNMSYIPFGSGRRICAGLPLAEIMLNYILASLLHSFHWRLRDGEEVDMSDEIVSALRKRIPLIAIPLSRLPCSDLYQ